MAAVSNFGPTTQIGNADSFRPSQFLKTQGQGATAVAICSGQIRVQQTDDPDKVTVILRPHYQPSTGLPEIAYFLYRGVRRSSLISANNGFTGDTKCPFVERAIIAHDNATGGTAVPDTDWSEKALGLYLDDVSGGYQDDDPLDQLFYYRAPNGGSHYQISQAPFVKAGEKIGEFESEAGVEIVLNRLASPLTLAHVRSVDPLLTRAATTPNFATRYSREDCLSHLDPCAFFASFSGWKLQYWDQPSDMTGVPNRARTTLELRSLLERFPHPNRIYLDIRNDYGSSLDLFGTYPDTQALTISGDGTTVNLPRDWHGWPLRVLEYSDVGAAGLITDEHFNTTLTFSTDQHAEPLIYLSRAFARLSRKLRPFEKAVKSNETPLSLPMDGTGHLLSGYYKINYYDMKRSFAPGSPGWGAQAYAPAKDSVYNGLFRPRIMRRHFAQTQRDIGIHIWNEEVLVNLTDRGGPCYIAKIGLAEDDELVTLFAVPEFFVTDAFRKKQAPSFQSWLSASENVLAEDGRKPTALEYLFDRSAFQQLNTLTLNAAEDPLNRLIVASDAPGGNQDGIFRVNGRFEHGVFFTFAKGPSDEFTAHETQLAAFPNTEAPVFWSEDIPATGPVRTLNDAATFEILERSFTPTVWTTSTSTPGAAQITRRTAPKFKVYEVADS